MFKESAVSDPVRLPANYVLYDKVDIFRYTYQELSPGNNPSAYKRLVDFTNVVGNIAIEKAAQERESRMMYEVPLDPEVTLFGLSVRFDRMVMGIEFAAENGLRNFEKNFETACQKNRFRHLVDPDEAIDVLNGSFAYFMTRGFIATAMIRVLPEVAKLKQEPVEETVREYKEAITYFRKTLDEFDKELPDYKELGEALPDDVEEFPLLGGVRKYSRKIPGTFNTPPFLVALELDDWVDRSIQEGWHGEKQQYVPKPNSEYSKDRVL